MDGIEISRRRRAIYAALALLSLFSAALIVTRYVYSSEQLFGGLIWNLFLAWIPFGLAILIYDRHRAGTRPLRLLPLAALWLLFLPAYIITDFKHLVPSAVVPLWVDIVVIAAPAWTGMLLGFLSLYLVQAVVRSLAGPRVAWVTAVAVLGLASFGVYLGRVLRWNSWDVLTHPRLLSDLDVVFVDPRAIGMTVLLSSFLTLSYLVLYAFMRLEGVEER
jgi:uncharacterized membrane protein